MQQNDEELDHLDLFEKGEHKRPKVVVVKQPMPEKLQVKPSKWDDPEYRASVFEGMDLDDN